MNDKGYSTGFAWIFGLVSLFGLGILYIVFNQVFSVYLVPTVKGMVNNSVISPGITEETIITVNSGIDKYMAFFHMLPFIIFFTVIIYMVIVAIRKEREGEMF